jgi:hypothetical protein
MFSSNTRYKRSRLDLNAAGRLCVLTSREQRGSEGWVHLETSLSIYKEQKRKRTSR